MRAMAWLRAKGWLLVARGFRSVGLATTRIDEVTLAGERWAERQAAVATMRWLGKDVDRMLARVREVSR